MSAGILVAVTDLRANSPRVHTFLDRETGATIDFTFRAGEPQYMPLKLAEHMIRRPEDYPDFDVRFAAEAPPPPPAPAMAQVQASPPAQVPPVAPPPPPAPPVVDPVGDDGGVPDEPPPAGMQPPAAPPADAPVLTPQQVRQQLYDLLGKAGVPFSKNAPTAKLMALAQEAAAAANKVAEPTA